MSNNRKLTKKLAKSVNVAFYDQGEKIDSWEGI